MSARTDITIYSKYTDPIEKLDSYKRTEIKNVVWDSTKGVNILRSGLITADAATILIYANTSDFGAKEYKKPKAWKSTPNVDMDKYFTLNTGDIIVKGIVDYDINIGGVAGLESKYDDVLKIKSVDDKLDGSLTNQHWRVGAG